MIFMVGQFAIGKLRCLRFLVLSAEGCEVDCGGGGCAAFSSSVLMLYSPSVEKKRSCLIRKDSAILSVLHTKL
jgi:hypothetical protein